MIVVARVRPLNRKEIEMGTLVCLDFNPNKMDITVKVSMVRQVNIFRKAREDKTSSPSIGSSTWALTRRRFMI